MSMQTMFLYNLNRSGKIYDKFHAVSFENWLVLRFQAHGGGIMSCFSKFSDIFWQFLC